MAVLPHRTANWGSTLSVSVIVKNGNLVSPSFSTALVNLNSNMGFIVKVREHYTYTAFSIIIEALCSERIDEHYLWDIMIKYVTCVDPFSIWPILFANYSLHGQISNTMDKTASIGVKYVCVNTVTKHEWPSRQRYI